jgi:uncharacterized protein
MRIKLFIAAVILLHLTGCGRELTPEQREYYNSIEDIRENKNNYMKNDASSPFNQDPGAEYRNLKYFDINPDYVFTSRLYQYPQKDTIIILGTKGEERKTVKYGYVILDYKGEEYRQNVYQGTGRNGDEYYSIWFTDQTTGNETYGVGRYIDFEYEPDTTHIYTIDFNLAYNPYCAYSSKYSCAIPTKEDHLDLEIKAGEKSFH